MILIIDNYDSFVDMLAMYVRELGYATKIVRNDEIDLQDIEREDPSHIIISPGPCTPNEAGISMSVIKQFYQEYPILGVCLGHQAIGAVFGGDVVKYTPPVHGRISKIFHHREGLFTGLPDGFNVTRYHSLTLNPETLPDCLEKSAWLEDGSVMAISHKEYPLYGVQFHPEAYLTEHGHALLKNFLEIE